MAVVTDRVDEVTAPGLLWMNSRRAKFVAATFVAATVASLPSYGAPRLGFPSPLLLLLIAVGIVGVGIAVLMTTSTDPMPRGLALAVAVTVPASALVTALAVPGPLSNPNQANALGAGVAVCAFLCVRGRVMEAWVAQAAAVAVMTSWGALTGQSARTGFMTVFPNLAVLLMATLFAGIMRPAAREIRRLHAAARTEIGKIAASEARVAERERQDTKLQELVWPIVTLIAADGTTLTSAQIENSRLTAARLRDSVRAPILDVPEVVSAARAARARGVNVVLMDDGGLTAASESTIAGFRAVATQWLTNATDGEVTVRVLPPERDLLATIVAVSADGTEGDFELSADAPATSS